MVRFESLLRLAVICSCWLLLLTVDVPTATCQTANYSRLPGSNGPTYESQAQYLIAQETQKKPVEPSDANPSSREAPEPLPSKSPDRDLPRSEPSEIMQIELPSSYLIDQRNRYPINLETALQLVGGNNVQVALARERVCEADARLASAQAMWLPSLNVGAGFNHHDGTIQDTSGQVLQLSRGSVFAGGGATVSSTPLAGGSNGPVRLGVDLSLADAFFGPLAARQGVRAAKMAHNSKFNDVLFQVATSYWALSRAQSVLAIALESEEKARELLRLTMAQVKAEVGLPADVARAQDEWGLRQRQISIARESIGVASAELSRLLRLDPSVILIAQDQSPLPLDFVTPTATLTDLIAQGIAQRPERGEAHANVQAAHARKRQEELRPWIPNIHAGYSAGGFAGGTGSFIGDYGSRGDFDVQAVWQVRNLGLGNSALRQGASSQFRQAHLAELGVRDQIASEVSTYYYRMHSRREQIEISRRRVEATSKALPLNFRGIIGRQLRAIEAQQAIAALNAARTDYLDAIIQYNRAQFGLLRSIGGPSMDFSACGPMYQ